MKSGRAGSKYCVSDRYDITVILPKQHMVVKLSQETTEYVRTYTVEHDPLKEKHASHQLRDVPSTIRERLS